MLEHFLGKSPVSLDEELEALVEGIEEDVRKALSHFDEIAVRLKQKCDVDLAEHDGLPECVSLQPSFDPSCSLLLLRQVCLHRLNRQVRNVNVAGEECSRFGLSAEQDAVNLAALLLAGLGEMSEELPRQEQGLVIYFRRLLQFRRHVDVRRQVACVDLVKATQCTFDGPA